MIHNGLYLEGKIIVSLEGRSEDNNNNNNLVCRICKQQITKANLGYVIYRQIINDSPTDRIFHSTCYSNLDQTLGRDLMLSDMKFTIAQGKDFKKWMVEEQTRLKEKLWPSDVKVEEIDSE